MKSQRQFVFGMGLASLLFMGLLCVTGCSKKEDAASDEGGTKSGASGGMSGGGMRPGGPGAKLAENATGEEIFQKKCQSCHGSGGKAGRAPALNTLASEADDKLVSIIQNGKEKMPAFSGQLSEDQIKKVVAYVKGLK